MEIFAVFVITFEPIKIQTCSSPQNDRLNLSFVKDIKVIGKKPTRYGHKMDFCQLQRPFISRKFDAPPSTFLSTIQSIYFVKFIITKSCVDMEIGGVRIQLCRL